MGEFILWLGLPIGTTVRFPTPVIGVDIPGDGRRYSSRLLIFNREANADEDYEPGAVLEGHGRTAHLATANSQYLKFDHFTISARFPLSPPDTLQIHLPSLIILNLPIIEVNGIPLPPQVIPLKLVEKTAFRMC